MRTLRFAVIVLAACGGGSSGVHDGAVGDDGGAGDAAARDGAPARDGGLSPDAGPGGDGAVGPLADVHFIGRTDTSDPAGPRFSFSGSAVFAHFSGTGISAKLKDGGTNQWAVVIDGGAPTLLKTSAASQTYALATGLPAGMHTVELHKRTENYVGVVQFLGFTVTGGALVASPEPFSRRIELIGDSITCGYGDEGASATCSFSDDTENEYLAYGAVAARALDASHSAVAYSGKGVYRNYGGDMTDPMPVIYGRTMGDLPTPAWDFTRNIPDVVVINLGTNDFSTGDPGQPYVTAMTALVHTVRGHYPQARIVLALGPMLGDPNATTARGYLQGIVTSLTGAGDSRVSFVDFGTQMMPDGCDYHPSVLTHSKMAATLVTHIRGLTGW